MAVTAPAPRERRTRWGFLGYQPFAGAVNVGRVLKFAALLPQSWCFHCSPRSDTPSPDCLGLTHSLVLVEAERGGGSLQSSRDWSRFDKAPVSFAPARAAVPGAAELSGPALPVPAAARRRPPRGRRRVDPAAPSAAGAAGPRRFQEAERARGELRVLGNCCSNIAIAL